MYQDLFVALVALLIGGLALFTAITNWEKGFSLNKSRWIESRWGRIGARLCYALIGTLLLIISIMLATGYQLYTPGGS